MKYCDNCGCKKYDGYCTNCDEEVFIMEQYEELEIPSPDDNTEFMQRYYKSLKNKGKNE